MNKQRRIALAKALPLVTQAQALMAQAKAIVESVRNDEQEVYDNLSEGQQGGDMGDAMQTAITDMDEAIDGIAGLDFKGVADGIGRAADELGDEIADATLSDEQIEIRRMDRLPEWAKRRLAETKARADAADARMADVFAVRDEKNPAQIVIDEFQSPVQGRVVPSDQVAFPGHGIRVYADRHGRGVMIDGTEMGTLAIMPQASNSVIIRIVKPF